MASGNAVCGSSAIGATAPVIRQMMWRNQLQLLVRINRYHLNDDFAILQNLLYENETMLSSALIGGILQSVGKSSEVPQ